MTVIKKNDFIVSVANALQYISHYHSEDFILAMSRALEIERSQQAKDAILQILTNSKLAAYGNRPICQDTGIVTVFVKQGMDLKWDSDKTIEEMVNQGVRNAYLDEINPLRPSIVKNPISERINTKDNSPAVVHINLVPGDSLDISIAAKGAGSENKAVLGMLNPSDSIVDFILAEIPKMGAGWCPPGVLGVGIGGTADKAMVMAKESLFESIDIQELIKKGPSKKIESLRVELYEKINRLGIGAQGLGGLTTVLDVKIKDYPTHAASLPVAIIPNCAANRHIHFRMRGDGAVKLKPPNLEVWPKTEWSPKETSTKVNLDTLQKKDLENFTLGQSLLLSGKILTARDAAHKKLKELKDNNQPLPDGLDLKNRFIYYVGPVDPVGNEVIGPAGPTTSSRMDKYSSLMLEDYGVIGMIGKAERGKAALESIKKNKVVYLIAIGGAAYLISQAIKSSKLIAFPELGMEAIYEFEVKDMPVTLAANTDGDSLHEEGVKKWNAVLMKN
ncbi:fumarate hydratase [Methylophilaceae bacterium]|nr:fumarate hydratase [Methylophilaceae bacterium]